MSHLQQHVYKLKWNKETNADTMAVLTLQEEGILCEKVKQYPVLSDKQLIGYREKDVVIWSFYYSHAKIIRRGA